MKQALPLFLFLLPSLSRAATITVDLNGGADYTDIQSAIDAAADGDTVIVKPGEYVIRRGLSFNRGRDSEDPAAPPPKNLVLRSEVGPGRTTIRLSPGPKERPNWYWGWAGGVIFENGEGPTSRLEGFTVTGVDGLDLWSGGIVCSGSSPVISNCVVRGNRGITDFPNAGIYCRDSSPTIVGCTVEDNWSGYDNDWGGGIVVRRSSASIVDCVIAGNWSGSPGGGIACGENSSAQIRGCTIAGNGSWGVLCSEGEVTLTDCTIVRNESGVACGSSTVIENCTIAWNERSGIQCGGTSPRLRNCIIWGHPGSSIESIEGGSPSVSYSCVQGGWPGTANLDLDPLFCGWGSAAEVWVDGSRPGPGDGTAASPWPDLRQAIVYSFALSADSPCRGAGDAKTDIGAPAGVCPGGPKVESRTVHIAAGTYRIPRIDLFWSVSLAGAGRDATVIEGNIVNLRGGSRLSGLQVTGGLSSGITVRAGESPEILDCTIARNRPAGLECGEGSSPTLSGCLVVGNELHGLVGMDGSTTTFVHCTVAGNGVDQYYSSGLYTEGSGRMILRSTIVWGNGRQAIQSSMPVDATGSCIEGQEPLPGTGNIDLDPLFAGWDRPEVFVDAAAGTPGDGSSLRPFPVLQTALGGYRYCLSDRSPCLGAGEGGSDMGAFAGSCGSGSPSVLVHVGPGTYDMDGLSLQEWVSIEGAGEDRTVAVGTIGGLRTGASLSRLTVTGGLGAGIRIAEGQAPRIESCTVRDCSGQGIYCIRSSPVMTDCTVSGAFASSSGNGTGVLCAESSPIFTRCKIVENGSAGLEFVASAPKLIDCTISRNMGAGIYCETQSSPLLDGCIISDNRGSGLSVADKSTPVLDHCTITGNVAEGTAGINTGWSSLVTLKNSIVWGNSGENLGHHSGSNLTASYSCIEGPLPEGPGVIGLDPLFAAWPRAEVHVDSAAAGMGDGTLSNPYRTLADALAAFGLALAAGSPCLGSGEGGTDMGAATGRCEAPGSPYLFIRLAPGGHPFPPAGPYLSHQVSVQGAGKRESSIQGTVYGLRTGSSLSSLTVTGGTEGGIVVSAGEAPLIRGCTISGNGTDYGRGGSGEGAGIFSNGGAPILDRTTIEGNAGMGLTAQGGSPSLTGCTVRGNQTGGIKLSFGAATVEDSLIIGNGNGGVFSDHSSLIMVNCVVAGNSGSGAGYAFTDQPRPQLLNCTIAGNKEAGVPRFSATTPRVVNCIAWGNGQGGILGASANCLDGPDPLFVKNGLFDFGRFRRAMAGGFPESLPDFILEEPDFRLLPGSPAIDAGTSEGAPSTDIEGRSRPCGAGVDIGAYEIGGCPGTHPFVRGDSNADGTTDISDAVAVLSYLFLGVNSVPCGQAGDANDDGALDISDAVFVVRFLFLGGKALEPPVEECGMDPTGHSLPCESFPGCQ